MGGHHIATPNPTPNPNPKPHPSPNPNPNPDQVWAGDPGNMVLVPGYCVQGTLGAKVQSGAKQIEVEGRSLPVRCKVSHATLTPTLTPTITLTLTLTPNPNPNPNPNPLTLSPPNPIPQVSQASFSAHADAKGILQLIRTAQPRCVMLVHGEPVTMAQL